MAEEMSNEEIVAGFDELFGSNESDDETNNDDNPEDEAPEDEGESDESNDEGNKSDEEDDESKGDDKEDDDSNKEKPDDSASKQNFKFAEMRTKLKAQENLLKNLGKAIGLDDKTSVEDVANKVSEILIKKQSQETGIPEDVLLRLQTLEAQAADTQQLERQTNTQNAIANLIEKYSLSQEQVDGFVQQLVDNGRNPIEVDGVDIETEYIKHNYQSMMKKAIDDAKAEERDRIKKAESQSSSPAGGGPGEVGTDKKITTVKDLDKFFDGIDL